MKKLAVYGVALAMLLSLCACDASDGQKNKDNAGNSTSTSSNDVETNSNKDNGAFIVPTEPLSDLEQIDSTVTDTLIATGYSIDHASAIQEILNTVGITEIEIESMTGEAESGLNSVVCYPNGYTDKDRRFFFTTEDGALFYAGFSGEDLYDSENGGFLKNYSDVHVPEKEVTLEVYGELQSLATSAVKQYLNYPDTADFGALDWKIGRSDEKYQILGKVTAKNGFGVKDDILFSVWFIANGTEYTVEGISLNGVRVK